jgi:hypothetical protein
MQRVEQMTIRTIVASSYKFPLLVVIALLAFQMSATAQSELELISGSSSTTVGGPFNGNDYGLFASVGSWSLNFSTGAFSGTSGLELSSLNATTSGTSTPLEILWSSSFESDVSGTYMASASGTLTSGVAGSFSSYYGSTILTTANPLTAPLSGSTSPFGVGDSGTISGSATFLTEEVVLSGATNSNSQISFAFYLTAAPVPEPGTFSLLSLGGLAAITCFHRKRRLP